MLADMEWERGGDDPAGGREGEPFEFRHHVAQRRGGVKLEMRAVAIPTDSDGVAPCGCLFMPSTAVNMLCGPSTPERVSPKQLSSCR